MQSSKVIAAGASVVLELLASAPVFAANDTVHIQTVVWASKENPVQKRAV
ncbi:MAG: hypothetical protein GJU76_06920, partial [Gallionella sp.]|nr:hypothetical protein [Gallionella sp.]